jgi:uncharacterized protein YutE (UPF0331/DUF86 family)
MVDQVVLVAKVAQIEKCLIRVKTKRSPSLEHFETDVDNQDVVLFNLMQAIQGCIDLAAHVVSDEGYGMAGSMQEFFYLLQSNQVISRELAEAMSKAVGFRNLVVHEYTKIDFALVHDIATNGLGDIEAFIGAVIDRFG